MKTGTFDYIKYDTKATEDSAEFKAEFEDMENLVNFKLKPGRASSLVKTKLEEAYMWVGKAIRDEQIVRNGEGQLNESRGV